MSNIDFSSSEPKNGWRALTTLAILLAAVAAAAYVSFIVTSLRTAGSEAHLIQPVEVAPSLPVVDRVPGAISAVNTYRAMHDLPALQLSAELSNSAQAKADDLVQHNYFAHFRDDKTPWDFMDDAGYQYTTAGENLAKCFKSADALVKAWIDSPAHRAILLGDYTEAGFGTSTNAKDRCMYVAGHFGSRV